MIGMQFGSDGLDILQESQLPSFMRSGIVALITATRQSSSDESASASQSEKQHSGLRVAPNSPLDHFLRFVQSSLASTQYCYALEKVSYIFLFSVCCPKFSHVL